MKTYSLVALIMCFSLFLIADEFYIGCQSDINTVNTAIWNSADNILELIRDANYNNTITSTKNGDLGYGPVLEKLYNNGNHSLNTVLMDYKGPNTQNNNEMIDPNSWTSVTALVQSNYQLFEAEYYDTTSVSTIINDSSDDEFWYCSNSNDLTRIGTKFNFTQASNRAFWQAVPGTNPAGYVFTNIRWRWDSHDITKNMFRFTGNHLIKNYNTLYESFLQNTFVYITFAFRIPEIDTVTTNSELLRFEVCKYDASNNPILLSHINTCFNTTGQTTFMTKSSYAGLPEDFQSIHNKLVTIKLSLWTLFGHQNPFPPNKGNWKLDLDNISPRLYWYGRGVLNLDYVLIEDDVYRALNDPTTGTRINNYLNSNILTLPHANLISNIYGSNEPRSPQMKSYQVMESLINNQPKMITSTHSFSDAPVKPNNELFDEPYLFLKKYKPKIFMPNIYPLYGFLQWNNSNGPYFVQNALDSMLGRYLKYKKLIDQFNSAPPYINNPILYYICVQTYGNWDGINDQWDAIRPPKEAQKCLQLLPLCYGVKGISDFTFQSHNASVSDTNYQVWGIVNFNDINSYQIFPGYYAIQEANRKIRIYGPIINNQSIVWKNAGCLSSIINHAPFELNSYLLNDLYVKNSDGYYQGYIQCGVYLENGTDPYFMLVNRRANYFVNNVNQNPTNQNDSNFNTFLPQNVLFKYNQDTHFSFGTYPALFDPYDSLLYVNYSDSTIVQLNPGDGRLLQMVSSLPANVSSDAVVKNTAYLQGEITISNGANVTVAQNSDITLLPHTMIYISSGSSSTIKDNCQLSNYSRITVNSGGVLNLDSLSCQISSTSSIINYNGTIYITNSSLNFNGGASIINRCGDLNISNSNCAMGTQGKILCLYDPSIGVYGNFISSNSIFEPNSSSVVWEGIQARKCYKVDFDNCEIRNAKIGIDSENSNMFILILNSKYLIAKE